MGCIQKGILVVYMPYNIKKTMEEALVAAKQIWHSISLSVIQFRQLFFSLLRNGYRMQTRVQNMGYCSFYNRKLV